MATQNSFADLMQDWQKLLAACAANAAELTTAEPQRAQVEKMLQDAKDLKAQQDAHTASKQSTVQQLDTLLKKGREDVRRLKAMVKATLGTDTERLVQFGIAPNRKRGKKKQQALKPSESPPPTAGPTASHPTGSTAGPPVAHAETGAPRNPIAPSSSE